MWCGSRELGRRLGNRMDGDAGGTGDDRVLDRSPWLEDNYRAGFCCLENNCRNRLEEILILVVSFGIGGARERMGGGERNDGIGLLEAFWKTSALLAVGRGGLV